MTVRSRVVTITTSATRISSVDADSYPNNVGGSVFVQGTAIVYVGGSDVTTSGATQGLPVGSGQTFEFEATGNDSLYGIVASGTCDVVILETGL